jgi:hypothetical protein
MDKSETPFENRNEFCKRRTKISRLLQEIEKFGRVSG